MVWRALTMLLCLPLAAAAVTPGESAPAIRGPDLQTGTSVELDAMRGKVVLVDFWASWCAPCLKSLPLYQQLRDEFARTDFEIVAVNVDEEPADALSFLKRVDVSFPIVRDDGSTASAWAPPTMPSSFLVDRDGKVKSRHIGFKPSDIDALRNEIRALVEVPDAR